MNLIKLFENEKFRKVFVELFESPKSVTELEEKGIDVSRKTIYDFLGEFRVEKILPDGRKRIVYDDRYIKISSSTTPEKLYQFTIYTLSDYLAEKLKLNPDEKKIQEEMLSSPDIENLLKKHNSCFEVMMTKLALTFVFIKVFYKKIEVPFSSIEYFKKVGALRSFSPEELDKFLIAIQLCSKKYKDSSSFQSLIDKMMSLDISISIKPLDWYLFIESISQSMKPFINLLKKEHKTHLLGFKKLE